MAWVHLLAALPLRSAPITGTSGASISTSASKEHDGYDLMEQL